MTGHTIITGPTSMVSYMGHDTARYRAILEPSAIWARNKVIQLIWGYKGQFGAVSFIGPNIKPHWYSRYIEHTRTCRELHLYWAYAKQFGFGCNKFIRAIYCNIETAPSIAQVHPATSLRCRRDDSGVKDEQGGDWWTWLILNQTSEDSEHVNGIKFANTLYELLCV